MGNKILVGLLLLFQVATWENSYRSDGIRIPFAAATHPAPVASTTYFVGGAFGSTPTASALALYRIQVHSGSGFVRELGLLIIAATPGSAETGSVYLRVNNTTDYLLDSNVTWDGVDSVKYFGDQANPITINTGDYFEIKIVTPAWTLAPVNVIYQGSMWLEP